MSERVSGGGGEEDGGKEGRADAGGMAANKMLRIRNVCLGPR